jgi:hypothetical protein
MAPKRSMQSQSRTAGRTGRPRVVPALAVAVSLVAVLDGAATHPAPRWVLRRWASTATTVATRPWRLGTSVLLTSGPRMTVGVVAILLAVGLPAEWRVGARAAALAGVAGTVVATVVCDAVLLGAAAFGSHAALAAARAPDYGVSAVTAGLAGALAATVPAPVAVILALVMLNGVAVHHGLADWEHVVAFSTGWATTRWGPRWARS